MVCVGEYTIYLSVYVCMYTNIGIYIIYKVSRPSFAIRPLVREPRQPSPKKVTCKQGVVAIVGGHGCKMRNRSHTQTRRAWLS